MKKVRQELKIMWANVWFRSLLGVILVVVVVFGGMLLMQSIPSGQRAINQVKEQINQAATNSKTNSDANLNANVDPNSREVSVYLIALDDNGQTGDVVGCGDSVVALTKTATVTSQSTTAAMYAALSILFSYHTQSVQSDTYYNALYQSTLDIESISIVGGVATVKLTGTTSLGGECDNPRFEAQITNTVMQFAEVTEANITINDLTLAEVVSGK